MIVVWTKAYIADHPFGKLVDIDSILAEHSGLEMELHLLRYVRKIDEDLDREMRDTFLQNTKSMERYDLSGFKKEWIT